MLWVVKGCSFADPSAHTPMLYSTVAVAFVPGAVVLVVVSILDSRANSLTRDLE